MLSTKEQQNLENTIYAASLLSQNLECLVNSKNPILTDIAIEILHQAEQIEQRLVILKVSSHEGENDK
jgi:hypothetical protein